MEQYQKPEMTIIELEKIDVLTVSGVTEMVECPVCGEEVLKHKPSWIWHMTKEHPDYVDSNPDYMDQFPG